jgi:hypothetical protein
LRAATVAAKQALAGAIVLAPPGAVADRWARRLADPVVAVASGRIRLRQRAKSRGVELPLVISDHADRDELNATIDEVGAPEVWVTHGQEDPLIHAMGMRGVKGRALRLVGYGEEDEGGLDGGVWRLVEVSDGQAVSEPYHSGDPRNRGGPAGCGSDGEAHDARVLRGLPDVGASIVRRGDSDAHQIGGYAASTEPQRCVRNITN